MADFDDNFLNDIRKRCKSGDKPGNWAWEAHGDIESLRYADEDRLWVVRAGGDSWTEVPGMG